MNKKLLPHLFLFLTNVIFGISLSFTKDVVPQYIKPFGAIVIRVCVSLVLFGTVYLFLSRERIQRKDIFLLIVCGFFGIAFNQLMFFKGLSITTPINAALIMTTTPILVVVISTLAGRDYLNLTRILGIVIGVCGAITVIAFGRNVSFAPDGWVGDILVLLNALSYGVYIVIVKPLMIKYHPLTVITFVFLFGSLFVVPVGYNDFRDINWQSFPASIWLELAFIVFCTTFLAYLFNALALRHISPSVAGIYIYLQPAIASAFALLVHKDVFSWEKLVATVLIFTGVYLVSFAGAKRRKMATAH